MADWRWRLTEAAAAHPSSPVFVWDDLAIRRAARLQYDLIVVGWPESDDFTLSQLDVSGRCAVRRDAVRQGESAATALRRLVQDGAEVSHVSDILRFVGPVEGAAYRPTMPPPEVAPLASMVSVIINFRDKAALTCDAIASIAAQHMRSSLEIVLIDNRSSPLERAKVVRFAHETLGADHILNMTYDAPYNHSAQNNLGVARARGEVVVLLNNDAAFLDAGALQAMADWAMVPGTLAVSPRIVGQGGRIVANGAGISVRNDAAPVLRENSSIALARIVRRSAGAPFSCAAVSKQVWDDLGGLDAAAFPTQYNDADFWLRGLARGLVCMTLGHVTARHEPGQSEPRTLAETATRLEALRARHSGMAAFAHLDPYETDAIWPPLLDAFGASASVVGVGAYAAFRRGATALRRAVTLRPPIAPHIP